MKILEKRPSFLKNINSLESGCQSVTVCEQGLFADKGPSICVFDTLDPLGALSLLSEGKYQSVVPMQNGFEKTVSRVANCLENRVEYFESTEQLFFTSAISSKTVRFKTKTDKDNVIEVAKNFAGETGSNRILESVTAIVEELFMNSMYDAPRESQKRFGTDTKADSWRELLFARDKENLIVSGLDLFGSLDIEKFLKRLHKVALLGPGSVMNMNSDDGGAGIGCFILYSHASNIWLGVDEGKRTRVTCEVPLGISYTKMDQIQKGIHII